MNYTLKSADKTNFDYLVKCNLDTILKYSNDLSKTEIEEINKYVIENINKEIEEYQIIYNYDNIIGCLLVKNYKGGKLIDEIYIEEEYRNQKIGSELIKNILKQDTYLWVYKDNKSAINLYKKLDFKIIEETKTRYFMKYGDEFENKKN